jgi:hypothetical protein
MKLKFFISIALTFSAISVMSAEVKIPKNILESHRKSCPQFAKNPNDMIQEEYKLPGATLYLLGCTNQAYNTSEKGYFQYSLGEVEVNPVAVAEFLENGSIRATTDLVGSSFDPSTLSLGTYGKSRSLGDCGSSATYKFDSTYKEFLLVEQRLKEECDGQYNDWPIIFKK